MASVAGWADLLGISKAEVKKMMGPDTRTEKQKEKDHQEIVDSCQRSLDHQLGKGTYKIVKV